jgi:methionyl-tRNA synthetase
MTAQRVYLSTTIPYVNSRPHLGYALEVVQADVLARHHRRIGDEVRLQSGTDDNSLKNVLAAEREGISTRELVNRNARAFADLGEHLSLSVDDFIRTSSDPRHRPGVERLWRACEASGDLYRKAYQGLYCVGCEQFYTEAELVSGNCPEHGTPPDLVAEENWFFRLSRYAEKLADLISAGELRIEPASRRNEVLGFISGGLQDFSVSRSVGRARGWGIGVPGDPSQVVYVWWDALGNYVTSLNAGAPAPRDADYQRWWVNADRRVHLVGKGVLRFHAVYWPAILLSAGQPLPTDIFVHDYLTVDGRRISKSAPTGTSDSTDPAALSDSYGADAVRWWLLREVPRVGDTDFTVSKLIARANEDLANGLGNLVSRVVALVHTYREGAVRPCPHPEGTSRWLAAAADARGHRTSAAPGSVAEPCGGPLPAWPDDAGALRAAIQAAPAAVATALARFDFRAAASAVFQIVEQANRYVEATQPWHLGRAERAGDVAAGERLDRVLGALITSCQVLAAEIWPFLPDLAARIAAACNDSAGTLPKPLPVFPRIELASASSPRRQYPALAAGPSLRPGRRGGTVPAVAVGGPRRLDSGPAYGKASEVGRCAVNQR